MLAHLWKKTYYVGSIYVHFLSLIMLTFAIYYLGTCKACKQAWMFLKIVANQ